jgi:uncharacterized repeat protein (TIGR02543 family)
MEAKTMKHIIKIFIVVVVALLTTTTAWATTTSTITVSGTDYTLFTGFTATDGTAVDNAFVYGNAVDGNTSTSWHPQSGDTFVEFNTDDPIIPKGYIFNTYMEGNFYPHVWVLKAKANATDDWTTLSSYSGQTLPSGQEFQYACSNDGNTAYKYFRFEASNTNDNIWLTEIRLYGFENLTYTHLTVKAATCTEVGIKQECYRRSDGKYFTDETGATELAEADVIDPMIPHTGVHHEADEDHIEYWQCSMCNKYFSDAGCTTEITETQSVTYLDESGTEQTCLTYTTMTDGSTSLTAGWYVVNDDVTIADRISVSGTVNLILCNGATLTASKGTTVGSDATLNIYAQTNDEATMGALVADATNDNANWYAGIGGVNNTAAGTITINGGKINAYGWFAAGIGSGRGNSTVGTITINGGIVTAQDNAGYSAGIGGGFSGAKASTINLNGGVIHAAGIGSGYSGGDCSITVNISDGVKKIVATPVQGGACIGSGEYASGSVTVNFKSGGNVVTGDAKDAVFYDTGEGSQRQVRARELNHAVTMSDDLKANITVSTEYAFTGETVTLTLGTAVDATTLSVNGGAVATTDAGNRQYTFTMPDGDVTVTATLLQTYSVSLPTGMEVVSATNAADADGKYITGTTVTFKASFPYAASDVSDGSSTLEPDANGIYTVTVADADVTVTATVERSATIDLSDATGDFNAIEGDVLTGSTSGTLTIADGAGITLSGATITGGIVCSGTATITLVGTNSTTGKYGKAGIQIGGSGTTLTINGDGSLAATGGSAAAGIGLGRTWDASVTAGAIVIEGGTVNASGGNGIGTGTVGNEKTASIDGISIKGGTVCASLGKGTINFASTATIGYIKIYDTIDMVDASKITETVTYMHDETDVTESKADYFTIIENGDRRIIMPKDDTDYTITIADGIEHGTLTVAAATAKYMETVTINATPDFGYRLVRLVVKDAQNNDVAFTGNSFFMPKSNVTVSAEFEQGVHGTTEFAWVYRNGPTPEDQARETIYDGVTTVSIQTGRSYYIWKYNEDTYSNFRLDNDINDADIPYAGGTGEFYETLNVTNFQTTGNTQTGYYDITMTDVGNGKWGVSILPTPAQMDVVPDQTYTGSAITPEPLVIAGSLSLTKGTDYVYSYENNTNVGTATVRVTFQGDYASLGYVEKTFTIAPRTYTVSFDANGGTGTMEPMQLTYDGEWATLTANTFTRTGYSFKGWNTEADGTGTDYSDEDLVRNLTDEANGNVVLYAQWGWDIASCEIKGTLEAYDDGYGPYNQLAANVEVWDGDTQLTLDTDYTIELDPDVDICSYEVGEQYQATVTGMGNWFGTKTFTFTFVALHHTVVFVANGGSGTMASGTVANDGGKAGRYTLPVCGFTAPDGKVFDHWVVYYTGIVENPIKQPGDYFTSPYIYSVYDVQTITVTAYWRDALILLDDDSNQPVGSKNADIIAANDGTTELTVQLQGRTLYKDGKWNTLCLPFALSAEQIAAHTDFSGATLMELDTDGKNGFDTTDGTLYLTFKSATAIAAGVPYLVKWDAAGTDFTSPTFSGVTINATATTTVSDADGDLQEVQMVGSYSPVPVVADDKSILFLGDANTLYYSSIDRNIRSCRAYFSVPYIKGNAKAMARAFHLDFGDGEQTGITTTNYTNFTNDDDAWYSLDGRKLNGKPTKSGVYVNGGRKVVIK